MTKTTKIIVGILGLLIIGLLAVIISVNTSVTLGSAPSGLPATFATTSTTQVGPSKVSYASSTLVIFVKTTNCASRVISNPDTAIRIWFSNDMFSSTTANPTLSLGHFQATGTTQVYDSGLYGCGFVNGHSYATTTLTISEFN